MKAKEKDQEVIYNIISPKEMKIECMNMTFNIGYISGHSISEYDRIIEQNWVNEWKTTTDSSEIILEKLSKEETHQIKVNQIIKNIEYEIDNLKKMMIEYEIYRKPGKILHR